MFRGFSLFILFDALLLCQGCNIKGANDPFSYAPERWERVWTPPCDARYPPPSTEDLEREKEEYEAFSHEAPLSLAESIDIALSKSPDTRGSWANARISASEYGQSLQNNFILATGNVGYNRSRIAQILGNQSFVFYQTQYGGALELTYTILDFGQTRMSSEAALQSLYNADWSHNSQIQKTIQSVMDDYYNYLYQKRLLEAVKQDLLNAKISLDATEERFKSGLADVSDKMQATTSYLSEKLQLVNQEHALYNSYTQLVTRMGLPADGNFQFQDQPKGVVPFDVESLDALLLKASEQRPDLMAAEQRKQKRKKEKKT